MMRICSQGDAHSLAPGDFKQANLEILPVGVAIDFDGFVQARSFGKHAGPFSLQAGPIVVNAALRMTEDLDGWVAQRRKETRGLNLLFSQCRMKRSEHDIEFSKNGKADVYFAINREIHFGGSKHFQTPRFASQRLINDTNFLSLRVKPALIEPFKPLVWSVMPI